MNLHTGPGMPRPRRPVSPGHFAPPGGCDCAADFARMAMATYSSEPVPLGPLEAPTEPAQLRLVVNKPSEPTTERSAAAAEGPHRWSWLKRIRHALHAWRVERMRPQL